jgi:hypothetical protein
MTVRDSNNRVSTTSRSQWVWTRLSRLWNMTMNQLPNSFYTASLDEVIERLMPLQIGNYHLWLCWSNQAMVTKSYDVTCHQHGRSKVRTGRAKKWPLWKAIKSVWIDQFQFYSVCGTGHEGKYFWLS